MDKVKDGAKALILSPDKILLFHRDNILTIRFPDYWHTVGGGIEEGETPEQALLREIKEEVTFVPNNHHFVRKAKGSLGEGVYYYVLFVDKDEEKKFVLCPGEGQEIKFFTIENALKLKITPNTILTLTNFRKQIEQMMLTRIATNL